MKFIHAADLHLDSPLRGLDGYAGAPVERLRGATRQAFLALIDTALRERVDLMVLAGDIFDGNWQDFHTGLFFREQMVRLTRAGVRVFIAKGNHDADSQISRQLPAVDGVHTFSTRSCETVTLPDLGVALHGRSFPQRAVNEDFVAGYNRPAPGLFNIGVLHTSLTGSPEHDTYAPTTLAALVGCGYDYFALGHIHARQVVQDSDPRIVFPGNLQGRHARETGAKGAELVTVAGGRIVSAQAVVCDVVRWHQRVLDVDGLTGLDALAALCARELASLVAEDRERLHAVRLSLRGQTVLHRLEAGQPGTLRAAVLAAAQDLDADDVWIEQVVLELRSPMDRVSAARRDDAFGEVIRLVDELAADETALRAFVHEKVGEVRLPAELGDAALAAMPLAALRQTLADAEASVLAVLGEAGTTAGTSASESAQAAESGEAAAAAAQGPA